MSEPEVFVQADRALQRVIAQITDEQWSSKVPDWLPRGAKQADLTLRELINYHAYDDAWVPDMLSGKTMDQVGKAKFDGDLLGDDPKASFAAIVDKACQAAEQFTDLDMIVHCSFGDFPARDYFWQINQFRALRARDIAKVIGADDQLPEDLVQGIWDEVSPNAEAWRKIGVFSAEVTIHESASLQDKLLGLTGRQP